MKKVLILGAGMVVKPMVDYFLEKRIGLTIASPMQERANDMINGNILGSSLRWSMEDQELLERLVSEHDIIVSLLPYKFHTDIAKVCLRQRKSLVTTSYIQKEMLDMDRAAKEAGLVFLNEIGLDPGIDHMSAMRVIDQVHSKGALVEEFCSLCGALPAPEAVDNPFGYKFSWSPKGVILASRAGAFYLKNGNPVYIESADLFKHRFSHTVPGVGDLEVYPNRDSVSYIEIYDIPETRTIFRGTLRFRGWCESLDAIKTLGLLDETLKNYDGLTYSDFLAEKAGTKNSDLKRKTALILGIPEDSPAVNSLEFLGLFGNEKLPYTTSSPFEITSDRMISKMTLSDNERDMVILQHAVLALFKDGRKEVIKSFMVDYGSASTSTSIARTVSLPAAIAVKLILENKIKNKGVQRPVSSEIYDPVLNELKTFGIEMKEETGLPENEMITLNKSRISRDPPAPVK